MVLVGNKLDLDREPDARQVFPDMAFDLCRRYGFGMNFETSAKAGTNVTELLSIALSRCEQVRAALTLLCLLCSELISTLNLSLLYTKSHISYIQIY